MVASWRAESGGRAKGDAQRRTLVACSGGTDSAALLLALAAAVVPERKHHETVIPLVVAHIRHDMRSEEEARADAARVQSLAGHLGIEVKIGWAIGASTQGEEKATRPASEASYRRLRYQALGLLAAETGCGLVVTGHHADDQLETMMIRWLRGTGPAGLAGMSVARRLPYATVAQPPLLVRPMLGIRREDALRIVTLAEYEPAQDATNVNEQYLRAAVRKRIVPEMERLSPRLFEHLADMGELLRAAGAELERAGRAVLEGARQSPSGGIEWDRAWIAGFAPAVIAQSLRIYAASVGAGRGVQAAGLLRAARLCADQTVIPRVARTAGLVISVTSKRVHAAVAPLSDAGT